MSSKRSEANDTIELIRVVAKKRTRAAIDLVRGKELFMDVEDCLEEELGSFIDDFLDIELFSFVEDFGDVELEGVKVWLIDLFKVEAGFTDCPLAECRCETPRSPSGSPCAE